MAAVTPEVASRTLYFGNLSPFIDEQFIILLIGQLNINCVSCKIIRESMTDPYCFVEFASRQEAQLVLTQLNQIEVYGKKLKANWAAMPQNRLDTSNHFHIFVGDLAPEIDNNLLLNAFRKFGEISDCKVILDPNTHASKGYGFISFVNEDDAAKAISLMNSCWVGSRPIRTNWASRKVPSVSGVRSFSEIAEQTTSTNTTIYVGGVHPGLMTDENVRENFFHFGHILSIRVFQDKGYAFVQFRTKDSAVRAIQSCGRLSIAGCPLKCSWGKENPGFNPHYVQYHQGSGMAPMVGYEQPKCMQNDQFRYYYPYQ